MAVCCLREYCSAGACEIAERTSLPFSPASASTPSLHSVPLASLFSSSQFQKTWYLFYKVLPQRPASLHLPAAISLLGSSTQDVPVKSNQKPTRLVASPGHSAAPRHRRAVARPCCTVRLTGPHGCFFSVATQRQLHHNHGAAGKLLQDSAQGPHLILI